MNILIIGGSGHVSGAVANTALSKKWNVWTVTRGTRPVPAGVNSLIADRHDHYAMESAVSKPGVKWDMVVDCICFKPEEMRQDIELFKDCATQFVFISTDFVYDPAMRQFPQPEDAGNYISPGNGSQDYGYNKRLCELELINHAPEQLAWTILRPCHIYGPTSELGCLPLHGRDPELIPKMRRGEPLKLVGGGHFLQQPILVSDLAQTVTSIAENHDVAGKIFNMAGPDTIESKKYYEIIAGILGVELKIEEIPVTGFLKDNPGQRPFMCHRLNSLAALKTSGLAVPSTSIEDGLRQHVEGLLKKF